MPNKLQTEQPVESKAEYGERESFANLIRDQVIHALGTPSDLLSVQVRKIWDHHYRVNVIVGANAGSVRVANSFFLEVDGNGGLIAATPKITKQY